MIATIGVENIVVVDTKDALLVVDRNRAQDVARSSTGSHACARASPESTTVIPDGSEEPLAKPIDRRSIRGVAAFPACLPFAAGLPKGPGFILREMGARPRFITCQVNNP